MSEEVEKQGMAQTNTTKTQTNKVTQSHPGDEVRELQENSFRDINETWKTIYWQNKNSHKEIKHSNKL